MAIRPQSALTSQDYKRRDLSPTVSALQSSFYGGMSMLGPEEVDDGFRQIETHMESQMSHRGKVVERLNIKNILELTQ